MSCSRLEAYAKFPIAGASIDERAVEVLDLFAVEVPWLCSLAVADLSFPLRLDMTSVCLKLGKFLMEAKA